MKACRTIIAAAVLLASWEAVKAGAATLPNGFQETVVFQGLTRPTAVRFSPDGRIFIAEKSGLIKVFDKLSSTTPVIFADLRTEVDDYWDRGLLGLALHPNFPDTPYVYALYSYDLPFGGGPPWGDSCPNPPGATTNGCTISARLVRLTADGDVMTKEEVLLEAWGQQFPSHSIGDLQFGPDGALYVSGGDGASFNNVDYGQYGIPTNPLGDPPVPIGTAQTPPTAEGGALRSQSLRRSAGDPAVANGAILRVDDDGHPKADNPLIASSDPIAQRVVAFGLRNPYRFTIRPGTGELWIGDVGWSTFEEIDRLTDPVASPVKNFGWPCYEGSSVQGGYQNANLDLCNDLYATHGSTVNPYYAYSHSGKVVTGESCPTGSSSISGIAFYGSGGYPSTYNGALFFGDYSRQCIWAMLPDTSGLPNKNNRVTFVDGASTPVDLQIGPSGDLFYADLSGGTIRRIQYRAPTAVATADVTSGAAPLLVHFDGSESVPGEPGDTISYAWDFNGDGTFTDSTAVSPTHTYTQPGTFQARLQVTDNHNVSAVSDAIPITIGGDPPTVVIDTPPGSLTWKVGDPISFSGHATDSVDGTLPASAISWIVDLHHCPSNCHVHTLQTFDGVKSGAFPAPDHPYPSHLEIKMTATNSRGVSNSASVLLFPRSVSLTFQSIPTGVPLIVGSDTGVTPFAKTVIVGSLLSIGAPTPQTFGGVSYGFSSWSDGGAAVHQITAGASPATYVATYTSADLTIEASGAPTSVCPGGTVTYTMNVSNAGPTRAINVAVTTALPAGTSLVGSSGDGWSCSGTGPVVCSRALLDLGAAPALQISLDAPPQPGEFTLTPTVSSATLDPNSSNNSASVPTPVGCAVQVTSITPTSGPPTGESPFAAQGQSFMPGATVRVGGALATNVVVNGPTSISADAPSLPPGTLNDVVTENPGGELGTLAGGYMSDFSDTPRTYLFHGAIEKIFRAGITTGCGGGGYCPAVDINRASMAVFLLRGKHGANYHPPPAGGTMFGDVPLGTFLGDWIEQLATEGITSGCGGGNFCPDDPVNRSSMAVFLLRLKHGSTYKPPAATGTKFADVPLGTFLGDWIEQLANEGITGGCGGNNYCPTGIVSRGQMAAFLSRTLSLP